MGKEVVEMVYKIFESGRSASVPCGVGKPAWRPFSGESVAAPMESQPGARVGCGDDLGAI